MLITKIWSKQPGKYFCLATRSKSATKGSLKCHWFMRHQFPQVESTIEDLRQRNHVWFCAHGFNRRRRKTKYAEPTHFLYADLDNVNPRSTPVKPTMAVESSKGRYVGYWYIGEPVEWSQNQAWTYQIGADKGGWDPTQVLRAPGSINWKHDDAPVVKQLWSGSKMYRIEDFKLKPIATSTPDGSKAAKIFEKWEDSLPVKVRQELISDKVIVRDRSAWIWKTAKTLQGHGLTTREIFHLLWASRHNKYRNRRNGDKQLKRDIKKALLGHFDKEIKVAADKEGFFSLSMKEVEREEFDWVWEPYVAKGELTIIEGDPGVGKSWLAQMLAITVANGGSMPDEVNKNRRPGIVCFLDHENSMSTVMKARLVFNGLKNEDNVFQDEQSFDVGNEEQVNQLYEALERLNPDLVIFDTVMNYAGNANVYNPGETAKMFSTFRHIALEFHCGVVVIRHLNKGGSGQRAIYRGQGSITFTGTARSVIGVGYSPDDEQERLFKITKSNITDPDRVQARRFKLIPEGKECRFEWGGTLYISNEELLNTEKAKPADDQPVVEFLEDNLPKEQSKLLRLAEARGFDQRSLDRVRTKIGVHVKKTKKGLIWKLRDK